MAQVRKNILNGWKDIANYVGRDIRTVERWEKQRGLPIRRVPGAGRATVYALVSELDDWFASARPSESEDGNEDLLDDHPAAGPAASALAGSAAAAANGSAATFASATTAALEFAGPTFVPTLAARKGHWRRVAAMLAIAALAAIGWMLLHRRQLHRVAAAADPGASSGGAALSAAAAYSFDASHSTRGVPYPSRVPGVDDLYLRGIYSYEQRTPESLQRSEDFFQQAIANDPNYAPAYAGLSDTYNLLREYSVMPDAVAYPKAKAAAERAVQLDPRLPQAHASLGFIDFFWSSDVVVAEREFRTALQLDPSLVLAHHWYGSVLTHEGRFDEALEQLNIAQQLQPTSAAVLSSRALALGLDGHRGEAVDMMQDLLNQTPGLTSPHQILAILSLVQPRDIPRWLDETRRVAVMRHDTEQIQLIAAAGAAYRNGDEHAMWTVVARTENKLHPPPAPRPYIMAEAEAALGRNDAAFAILMPLVKQRAPGSMIIAMDPLLSGLRADPRYRLMMAETGIPAAMQLH